MALAKRGVFKAWYRIDGHEVLYAVKANGDRLEKIVVLRPGVSEARAYTWLGQVLDRVDPPAPPPPPRPRLQLVPDEAPKPKQLTVEQIDALYRDADPIRRLLWQRKKEEMARKGLRIS